MATMVVIFIIRGGITTALRMTMTSERPISRCSRGPLHSPFRGRNHYSSLVVDLKVSLLTSCFELKGPGPKKEILDTHRHTWPYEVLSPPLILIEANSPLPRHRHPCRLVAGVAKASFACYPPKICSSKV